MGEEKQSILRHLQEYEKKAMAAEKIRYRRKGKCMSNLDKFNGITVAEALEHEVVRQVYLYYTDV